MQQRTPHDDSTVELEVQKVKDKDEIGGYYTYKPKGQTPLTYYLNTEPVQTVFNPGSATSIVPLKRLEDTCNKCGEKLEAGDRKYYMRNNENLNLGREQFPYCRNCIKKARVANQL